MTVNILFLSDLHFGANPYNKKGKEVTNPAIGKRKNLLEKWLFPCYNSLKNNDVDSINNWR